MKTLTAKETAELLHMPEYTLKEIAANGGIPGAKVNRKWIFIESVIQEYLLELTMEQTSERRELLYAGLPPKVKPAVSTFSRRRPVLPALPVEA